MSEAELHDDSEGGKRTKHRSPNHPTVSLPKALERAKEILDRDKMVKIPIGLAHERWGYKRHSGAGNQVVAALKSFGLMDVEGSGEKRQVQITETARRILKDAPDRAELLRKAALAPPIHEELWEQYKDHGELPQADVLRDYLLWHRVAGTFNEDAVDSFIANLAESFRYAGIGASDKIGNEKPASEAGEKPRQPVRVGDGVMAFDRYGTTTFRVQGLSDDGEWAYLEGIEEAQPVSALTTVAAGDSKPAVAASAPPPNPFARRDKTDQQPPAIPGRKQDVYTLEEGDVILQWPSRLSRESYDEVKDWFDLLLRKLNRAVGVDKPSDD
ncbi:MAG: hypothetical protein IT428_14550 [Planctomycetaceae bacterium]|nr:hypothetical protein [Planctomycetaceae bacterium]